MKKNKTSIYKSMIVIVLMFLISLLAVNASISFYTGSVVVKSFNADVDINDKANVVLTYVLSGNEKVKLGFNNVPDSAQIAVNGKSYGKEFELDVKGDTLVIVKYAEEIGNETLKHFSLSPNILFDGNVNANRIGAYSAQIKMPNGVKELLSSSEKPTLTQTIDNRKNFIWNKVNSYASTLSINWHSLNIDIELQRIVPVVLDNEFTVKNVIKNNGPEISNVKLLQTFLESDFTAIEPSDEFEIIQAGNDVRLEWKKEITSIPSGSIKEFSYKLKVKNTGLNVVFRPLYVYVGSNLVKMVERTEYTTAGIGPLEFTPIRENASVPGQISIPQKEKDIFTAAVSEAPIFASNETGPTPLELLIAEKEAKKIQEITPVKDSFIKKRSLYIWIIAAMVVLLVILLFIFLNRRKEKGIRF